MWLRKKRWLRSVRIGSHVMHVGNHVNNQRLDQLRFFLRRLAEVACSTTVYVNDDAAGVKR